jgi:hypothetical protein
LFPHFPVVVPSTEFCPSTWKNETRAILHINSKEGMNDGHGGNGNLHKMGLVIAELNGQQPRANAGHL